MKAAVDASENSSVTEIADLQREIKILVKSQTHVDQVLEFINLPIAA